MFFHVVQQGFFTVRARLAQYEPKPQQGTQKKYRPAKKGSKKKKKKKKKNTFAHQSVFFKIYIFLSTVKFSFYSTSDIG